MQNTKIANYLIYDLSKKIHMPAELNVNSRVISRMVDDWNRNIYIVPAEAVKLRQSKQKKYLLM